MYYQVLFFANRLDILWASIYQIYKENTYNNIFFNLFFLSFGVLEASLGSLGTISYLNFYNFLYLIVCCKKTRTIMWTVCKEKNLIIPRYFLIFITFISKCHTSCAEGIFGKFRWQAYHFPSHPRQREKIKLNFYFHFFVVPQKVLWRPLRPS